MTMPIPDGSVVITPRQMYDELQATRKAVEKLTNTVDPALTDLRDDVGKLDVRVGQVDTRVDDVERAHGNRLSVIETKLRVLAGVLGTAIAGAAVVVPIVTK